ncbi:hypothetical protein [Pseudoduganella lutea]|uniref:Uncharacterized protein n=1 Tax=Pseudoduganella lutea TaxID=321985 RepID=A0A4P6KW06_9BURK|nr:hypothetical protein [Pseudoduganella lutea]QBE63140.1 hypothetical protein EWM63_09265 [Pseudoduganella lutea]
MHWYGNDAQCGEAKITVRSYCQTPDIDENAVVQMNRGCGEQELRIVQPGKKPVTLDLRKYEHDNDEMRIASSLRCVAAGTNRYLLVMFDNGGSCDTCEISAVLGLDGRWKSYGEKWLAVSRKERGAIEAAQRDWLQVPTQDINNMQRAEGE